MTRFARALLPLPAVMFAGFASHARAAEPALAEVMQMLAGVKISHARFVETRHMAILAKPLVLGGRLSYTRPNQLERQVLAPYEEKTLIADKQIIIENRTRNQRTLLSTADHPALFAFTEALRATLAGDRAALERLHRLEYEEGDGSRAIIELTADPA